MPTLHIETLTLKRFKEMGTLADTADSLLNKLIDHWYATQGNGRRKRASRTRTETISGPDEAIARANREWRGTGPDPQGVYLEPPEVSSHE